MQSTLDSKYKMHCQKFLEAVALRPEMYFRALDELHAMMSGHQVAFEQLQLVDNRDSFNRCFSEWLVAATGESDGAAGWAYTIKKIAEKQNTEPNEIFFGLVNSFFEHWSGSSNESQEN